MEIIFLDLEEIMFRKQYIIFLFLFLLITAIMNIHFCTYTGMDSIDEETKVEKYIPEEFPDFASGEKVSSDEYNEISPKIIRYAGKTYFYYASDNPALVDSQDGYDIYRATLNIETKKFENPINISKLFIDAGAPQGDEKYFTVVNRDGKTFIYYTHSETNKVYVGVVNGSETIVYESPYLEGEVSGHYFENDKLVLLIVNRKILGVYKEYGYVFSPADNSVIVEAINHAGDYVDGQHIGNATSDKYIIYTRYFRNRGEDVILSSLSNLKEFEKLDVFNDGNDQITPFVSDEGKMYLASNRDGSFDLFRWRKTRVVDPKDPPTTSAPPSTTMTLFKPPTTISITTFTTTITTTAIPTTTQQSTTTTTMTSATNQPPIGVIVSPPDGHCSFEENIEVIGTAWDDNSVSTIELFVNGISVTVSGNISWTASNVMLIDGTTNIIDLIVFDDAGLTSTDSCNVLVDAAPPFITIDSPIPMPPYQITDSIPISGSFQTSQCCPVSTIHYQLDGTGSWISATFTGPNSWYADPIAPSSLISGTHTIDVEMIDSCSNPAIMDVTFEIIEGGVPQGWVGDGIVGTWNQFPSSSSSGDLETEFNSPEDIAIDGSGNIYVCDMHNHRICKWDEMGNAIGWIGGGVTDASQTGSGATLGSDLASFTYPTGIDVDANYLYVADKNNNRIVRWEITIPSTPTASGWIGGGTNSWQTGIAPTDGSDYMSFNWPYDVAVDDLNNVLYITDRYNYRVCKWDIGGTAVGWVGSGFSGSWQTSTASGTDGVDYMSFGTALKGIAVGQNGDYIYIVDSNINRISRWNSTGNATGWIGYDVSGSWQTVDGTTAWPSQTYSGFSSPAGISVDGSDIYIAETNNDRISHWTIDGTAKGWIGGGNIGWMTTTAPTNGTDYNFFKWPSGVDVYDGELFISESGNHRVSRWTK